MIKKKKKKQNKEKPYCSS